MSGQVSDIFIFDIVDDDCTFCLTDVNFFYLFCNSVHSIFSDSGSSILKEFHGRQWPDIFGSCEAH